MPWPGPEFMKTANMSQQKENKELFQPLFSKRPSTMHKNTRSKCRQVSTLQPRRGRGRAFENQTGPIKTWPGRLWEKPPESLPGRTMSFLVWLLQDHNGRYSLNTCPRWSDTTVSQLSALEYRVLTVAEKWTTRELERGRDVKGVQFPEICNVEVFFITQYYSSLLSNENWNMEILKDSFNDILFNKISNHEPQPTLTKRTKSS